MVHHAESRVRCAPTALLDILIAVLPAGTAACGRRGWSSESVDFVPNGSQRGLITFTFSGKRGDLRRAAPAPLSSSLGSLGLTDGFVSVGCAVAAGLRLNLQALRSASSASKMPLIDDVVACLHPLGGGGEVAGAKIGCQTRFFRVRRE